jgi:glycosyltransferase involved in cell wall biosynthesis
VEPLVSIVVPVFNGLPHLRSTVESILSQRYTNLDIVISDGGSIDGSLAYVESLHDHRVRVIAPNAAIGAAANWTAATLAARGDFIKLVCQDDVLYPEAIALQVTDLIDHPRAVMASARRDIIDARGQVVYSPRGLSSLLHRHGHAIPAIEAVRACYLNGTNVLGEPFAVLFRAGPLKDVMPWSDTNPLMLDLTTYERVAPLGEIVIRRESVGAFRVSATSWSTRIAKQQLEQTRMWQEAFASTALKPPSTLERVRAMIGRHIQTTTRRAAYAYLKARNRFSH